MPDQPNLAEAIEAIRKICSDASDTALAELKVKDRNGTLQTVNVAVGVDDTGGIVTESLLPHVREAYDWFEKVRLEGAAGPLRREGVAHLQSLQSIIGHANRFKAEHSAVWANPAKRELVAVLDYHPAGPDSPARWGRHRGIYSCPLSEAWMAWGGEKGLDLDQEDFAALLDERDRELTDGQLPNGKDAPDPAALVSLAAQLEVFSTATARRERDPNTGRVKVSYAEEKGVSGTVQPPTAFLIRIPIFDNQPPDTLEVRLRVDVQEGAARFKARIHAASEVLRSAFSGLSAALGEGTGLPVFLGTPEA